MSANQKWRLPSLSVSLDYDAAEISKNLSKKTGVDQRLLSDIVVFKRSIDARRFPVTYSLTVDFRAPQKAHKQLEKKGCSPISAADFTMITDAAFERPIVVGFGPAGIFAAYYLAKVGHRPLIIERGSEITQRSEIVAHFWETGILDPQTNVQFGEGGAGAFSDGKLTTRVKDPLAREVFKILVAYGAPESILIDQKPHVGTDVLVGVVKRLRLQIEAWGGTFHFNERFESLILEKNQVKGITTDCASYDSDYVFLAIGHSARDTYRALFKQGVEMAAKPFAMGVRIEHPQGMINQCQFGPQAEHPRLGAADYTVKCQVTDRSVYSFCMCPGGYVINAASEAERLVVNGMSYHARAGENANSALLVSLTPSDFASTDVLAGMYWQEAIESSAFESYRGAPSALKPQLAMPYSAPVQTVGDFLSARVSQGFGAVKPTVTPDCHFVDFNQLLPKIMADALREALPKLGTQIRGFDREDALLTGVETRSSSPVRIQRDTSYESINIKGLFPIGEGAGYAGGITSAAVDGLAAVHSQLQKHRKG